MFYANIGSIHFCDDRNIFYLRFSIQYSLVNYTWLQGISSVPWETENNLKFLINFKLKPSHVASAYLYQTAQVEVAL